MMSRMHDVLVEQHPWLGTVPGPLAMATAPGHDDIVWIAGGGRGDAAVLRFDAGGWSRMAVEASGLRAVLPLSDVEALVAGEHGVVARVRFDERTSTLVERKTRECLFSIAKDARGKTLVGGDDGTLFELRDDGSARVLPTFSRERIAALIAEPDGTWLWAGSGGLMRTDLQHEPSRVIATNALLNAIARAPDGSLLVTGNGGQIHRWREGRHESLASGVSVDLDCVTWDPARARFVVGGSGGVLLEVSLDGAVKALSTSTAPRSPSALLPYRGGLLVASWSQIGPPYRFVGAIQFDGDRAVAPFAVREPPRQALPPAPERTVARDVTRFLGAEDGVMISMTEAKRRLGDGWPDWIETDLEHVRFFDGDVRVASTKALLAKTERRGFAVVVTGSLVVDGVLDAVAGGDGYDSVLVVGGGVHAESAIVRYGIKADIDGVFEVANVVVCSHGDDGGALVCGRLRARVLLYALYFSKPDAELDAFVVGDVYGDESFPPSRGAEIFVPEVLDAGEPDVDAISAALRERRPVLLSS